MDLSPNSSNQLQSSWCTRPLTTLPSFNSTWIISKILISSYRKTYNKFLKIFELLKKNSSFLTIWNHKEIHIVLNSKLIKNLFGSPQNVNHTKPKKWINKELAKKTTRRERISVRANRCLKNYSNIRSFLIAKQLSKRYTVYK